jgi:hypothetical protein
MGFLLDELFSPRVLLFSSVGICHLMPSLDETLFFNLYLPAVKSAMFLLKAGATFILNPDP